MPFKEFYTRFKKACSKHRLKIRTLANGACIAEKHCKRGPRLAYMSGVHGEERSGPLALLKWLEEGKLPKRCSIWICPLINDVGWDRKKRNWGLYNLNSWFLENKSNTPFFIPQIMRSLKKFNPTMFVDFHEDSTTDYPYLFRNIIDNSETIINLQKKLGIRFEPWKYDSEYKGASENFVRSMGCLDSTTIEAPLKWAIERKIQFHYNAVKATNSLIYG